RWAAARSVGRPPRGRRRQGWYVSRWARDRHPAPARHMVVASLTMALLALVTIAIFAMSTAVSFAGETYTQVTRDLPSAAQLTTRELFQTTKIYDRNGVLLDELYDQLGGRRTLIPLAEMSPWLVDATLAAEDANFYDNPGIDAQRGASPLAEHLAPGRRLRRQHDYPAARAQRLAPARGAPAADDAAQVQGGRASLPRRRDVLQGRHPGDVPERGVLRKPRLRDLRRGGDLLRQ